MNASRHDLIQRHMAGLLNDEESQAFQSALKDDPALRRLYLQYMNLDVSLEAHAGSRATVHQLLASSLENKDSRTPVSRVWLPFAAAAVVAVAGILAFVRLRSPSPAGSVATMMDCQGARWEGSTLPTEPGSELERGRLRLAEGLARLRFALGAEITLEGPAELELLEPQACRLVRGSLVAHVPEPARGFAVLTPSAKLIDHGTDFGVSTDERGHAKVQVMQGEVELRHANGAPPMLLTTREMAAITPETLLPRMPIEAEPRRAEEAAGDTVFAAEITTRSGRGEAAYVSEPRTEKNQSESLLLLKHCIEQGYGRKALLRFDLGALPEASAITQARLTVNLGPSGYGYASRGDDARIAVYALTRDDADLWNRSDINWESQPAFDSSAGRVNESEAVRVGEFTVPRGVQSGSFFLESPRLVERIRSDSNRLLTLILVRENAIQVDGGLVLGIAGNHHPKLPPPRLSVR